jgi:hypothetical protein
MARFNDENLKNFKETTGDVEKVVESFFQDLLIRIDKTTKDLRALLKDLNHKVKKLVILYQHKFREEFQTVRDEHERFQEDVYKSKLLVSLNLYPYYFFLIHH